MCLILSLCRSLFFACLYLTLLLSLSLVYTLTLVYTTRPPSSLCLSCIRSLSFTQLPLPFLSSYFCLSYIHSLSFTYTTPSLALSPDKIMMSIGDAFSRAKAEGSLGGGAAATLGFGGVAAASGAPRGFGPPPADEDVAAMRRRLANQEREAAEMRRRLAELEVCRRGLCVRRLWCLWCMPVCVFLLLCLRLCYYIYIEIYISMVLSLAPFYTLLYPFGPLGLSLSMSCLSFLLRFYLSLTRSAVLVLYRAVVAAMSAILAGRGVARLP